jgi:glutaminyl-peptide cyclotransferase
VKRTIGLVAAVLLAACGGNDSSDNSGQTPALPPGMEMPARTNADARPPAVPFDSATPRVTARALHAFPHDTAAYTQGLLVYQGELLESTGRLGLSDVREVNPVTGAIRRHAALAANEFGEGIAVVGDRLYQLTWQGGRGHIYNANTLAPVDSFTYTGEGWGLTTDSKLLYMSDGSSRLRVIDPAGFRQLRTIQVRENDSTVWMLNELEWVRGELWANIYQTSFIARIDPATGRVMGWVDLGHLLTRAESTDVANRGGVANGIAFDPVRNRLFVTGKLWPRLFEIALPPPVTAARP